MTTIEKLYAERVSQTDPIYSMLASQENLTAYTPSIGLASPTGSRPLAELNSMATTVINTIGFVPRAIGSAVVDTFRSRSSRASQTASKDPSLGSSPATLAPLPAKSKIADAYNHTSLVGSFLTRMFSLAPSRPEIAKIREKMATIDSFEDLSVRELNIIVEDYRGILIKINKL